MSIYLKLFLEMGIPFGVIIGLLLVAFGYPQALAFGLLTGLLYGSCTSLTLGFLHSRAVRQISPHEPEKVLGVQHTGSTKLQLSYDKAFNLCVDSLTLIKGCKVQKEDQAQGEIVAKAGRTWESWGEKLAFSVKKIDDKYTSVEVSSRPTFSMTLVDYGKNLWNVSSIIFFLESHGKPV